MLASDQTRKRRCSLDGFSGEVQKFGRAGDASNVFPPFTTAPQKERRHARPIYPSVHDVSSLGGAMKPADAYVRITNSVEQMVAGLDPYDADRALYMIARAALLRLSVTRGMQGAAMKAYALADEFVGTGPR